MTVVTLLLQSAGKENHLENQKFVRIKGSHPEMFLRKGVLKIYSKFTGDTHAEVRFQ